MAVADFLWDFGKVLDWNPVAVLLGNLVTMFHRPLHWDIVTTLLSDLLTLLMLGIVVILVMLIVLIFVVFIVLFLVVFIIFILVMLVVLMTDLKQMYFKLLLSECFVLNVCNDSKMFSTFLKVISHFSSYSVSYSVEHSSTYFVEHWNEYGKTND